MDLLLPTRGEKSTPTSEEVESTVNASFSVCRRLVDGEPVPWSMSPTYVA